MNKTRQRRDMTKSEAGKEQFSKLACHQKLINGYRNFTSEIHWDKKSAHLPKKMEARVLCVSVGRYSRLSDHLKKFQKVISSSSQIHTLNIDLSENLSQTNTEFHRFCHFIKGRTSLKHLILRLPSDCPSFISEVGIEHLCQTLKTLSSLQTLSLDLQHINKLNDKSLSFLSQTLSTMRSLEKLYLNFKRHDGDRFWSVQRVTNKISGVSKVLKKLRFLKSLRLDFDEIEKFDDDTALQSLGQAFGKLVSLQSIELDLNLPKNYIWRKGLTKVGIDSLNRGLRSLPFLKKMCLKLSGSETIQGEVIPSFGEKLEVLQLDFSGCPNLDDNGLSNVLKGFDSLENNDDSNLNICGAVTRSGKTHMRQAVKPLAPLKRIDLNFSRCPKIGSRGIAEFAKDLGQFTQLKELSLDFSGCSEEVCEKEGLEKFYVSLKRLAKLITLRLNFDDKFYGWRAHQRKMGEKDHIGKALKALTSLQSIDLNFGQCLIEEKDMKNLCSGLKNRTSLQSLGLGFPESSFSNTTFDILGTTLKTLSSLQSIKLKYSPHRGEKFEILYDVFSCLVTLKNIDFEGKFSSFAESYRFCYAFKTLPCLETLRLRITLNFYWQQKCRRNLMTIPSLKVLDIENCQKD